LFFLFLVALLVQGVTYSWATVGCKASKLDGYSYPGGGPVDLLPKESLLIQQAPGLTGKSFINYQSDKSALLTGASTGFYWRTWGPLFWTYVYEDIMSMKTFVVRDRPLNFGGSHQITRCDGTGPVYVVSEGDHAGMNIIRSLFGMYTSRIYNIWADNKVVAVSEKLGGSGQSHKQIAYRFPDKLEPFASAFLKDRNFQGKYDEWFVQVDENAELPAFVINAAAMMMAFKTADTKLTTLPKLPVSMSAEPLMAAAASDRGALTGMSEKLGTTNTTASLAIKKAAGATSPSLEMTGVSAEKQPEAIEAPEVGEQQNVTSITEMHL